MLLRLHLSARSTFMSSGAGDFSDHHHQTLLSNLVVPRRSSQVKHLRHRRSKSAAVICCNSSSRSNNYYYYDDDADDDGDYLEAVILVTETLLHYQMRIQGYQHTFSDQTHTIGPEFLRQFQSPTIFLKIPCDCDGDYLLPIIVGESAVEMLISSSLENEGFPNHFQLVRNIVGKLGYQVKRVLITERVDNVYYADIYFHKPGTEDIRVDIRPSDAINVAKRCRAPIYVSKQIVLSDAIKIVYKTDKLRHKKSTYDVFLDSAIDGPDVLVEELHLVTEINLAVKEERYSDAVMWRDKLLELRSREKE